jgi:hypothetical protein
MVSSIKLDFWIKNNYNVLFVGRHGVGKTACVSEAFSRNNLKWKYFSASTMDPWVDFIGVPKEKLTTNKAGEQISYLDLIRPLEFQTDEIEALFFDEFNRAGPKIRNAVMELIQFKSINGKKFNNLKLIWAAINPENDETAKYDVDTLDPAQEDRFHVKIELPYEPYYDYFKNTYGKRYAESAISWWKKLPVEIKNKVSPRRLDYALNIYNNSGDMRDVLPHESNVSKLITELTYGSISKKLKEVFDKKDIVEAKKFISSENNYSACIEEISDNFEYMGLFIPLLEKEKIASLMSGNKKILDYVTSNGQKFNDVLVDIIKAGQNNLLIKKIKKKINFSNVLMPSKKDYDCIRNTAYKKYECGVNNTADSFELSIIDIEESGKYKITRDTTWRKFCFSTIKKNIPDNMTYQQCFKVLEFLSEIISHSNTKTMNKNYSNISGLINHCLSNLCSMKKMLDIRDFTKQNVNMSAAIDHVVPKSNFFFSFQKCKN